MPKVKFSNIPLQMEVGLIRHFLFDAWGWGSRITKLYPELKKAIKIKDNKKRDEFIFNFLNNYRIHKKKTIKNNLNKYKFFWNKIEKDYFLALSEIIGTKYPVDKKYINAYLSLNPICPRFLDTWSFSLFYNYKDLRRMKETIMHECCHFLYFKKWKELFPKAKRRTFDSPYIEWHLSEIAAPIVLNDSRLQKILKQSAHFYLEHEAIKIGNKTAPQYFTEIYQRTINKKNGFELFLRESYKEIKKYRKFFKKK